MPSPAEVQFFIEGEGIAPGFLDSLSLSAQVEEQVIVLLWPCGNERGKLFLANVGSILGLLALFVRGGRREGGINVVQRFSVSMFQCFNVHPGCPDILAFEWHCFIFGNEGGVVAEETLAGNVLAGAVGAKPKVPLGVFCGDFPERSMTGPFPHDNRDNPFQPRATGGNECQDGMGVIPKALIHRENIGHLETIKIQYHEP